MSTKGKLTVGGHAVPQELQDAIVQRMKDREFRCMDLTQIAARHPGRLDPGRVADRIIQRERKAGRIDLVGHALWRWKAA